MSCECLFEVVEGVAAHAERCVFDVMDEGVEAAWR
jgi:hypothetical protein